MFQNQPPGHARRSEIVEKRGVGQPEDADVSLGEGELAGGGAQMRKEDVRIAGVEGIDLDRRGDDGLGMRQQVLVQRVVPPDEHGDAGFARAARSSDLLGERGVRARPPRDDDGVQPGDVDAEFQGVRARQGANGSRSQCVLECAAFFGQVAAPVGCHRVFEPWAVACQPVPRDFGDPFGPCAGPNESDGLGALGCEHAHELPGLGYGSPACGRIGVCGRAGIQPRFARSRPSLLAASPHDDGHTAARGTVLLDGPDPSEGRA